MHRIRTFLLLGSSLLLRAQGAAESLHWRTELDLLPLATGGWYASLGAGRNTWRIRAVAAEVRVPDVFSPRGWKEARTRAQALLVDRFFRPGFEGPWAGAGLEHWDEELKQDDGTARVRLSSLQATLGAGWFFPLGNRWTLNPWVAVHQRVAGDREVASGQAVCRPRALQAEASLKVGYSFH